MRLVESIPIDFLFQGLRDAVPLQDTVLTEEKPVLKCELGERESKDQLLPREERPVEPAREALNTVSITTVGTEERCDVPARKPESWWARCEVENSSARTDEDTLAAQAPTNHDPVRW